MRPLKYKEKLIDKLNSTTEDGILDSIKYCLENYRNFYFRDLLKKLTYTDFGWLYY